MCNLAICSGKASRLGRGLMRTILAAACVAGVLGLAGCATPVKLMTTFDPSEVTWAQGSGTNAIRGSAVLRTVGGDTRTCAALPVMVIPDSGYARERINAIYGNLIRGYNPSFGGRPQTFTENDPRYLETGRRGTCDAQGAFAFSDLPDGTYFVVTAVIWKTSPDSFISQGGVLMQRVILAGGRAEMMVLSNF
jgi:hypothetical protein